jgi:cobyrinic acid a,c-diamide synthase
MPHVLVSAAHKSSGKTTITLGLCAALAQRRLAVQPFKKGPDYIDPMWLSLAAGRPCHNLDFYTMGEQEIRSTFARWDGCADISLVEGNKGLYDGLDLHGSNSNAALAGLLGAPVLLVIDARGMTRGIAPLILGYQAFDRSIRISGVILNRLGGSRHEAKLRAVIEHYTDVPVLGAVYQDPELEIVERHLGLMPSSETTLAEQKISRIAEAVAAQVDLDLIRSVAATGARTGLGPEAPALPTRTARMFRGPDIRIGIPRDAAFGFYYPGDLEALQAAGAELVFMDTLRDMRLPEVNGLFIGGGFPEIQMQGLEANAALRSEIRTAVEAGMPVYAECGGLMYLARSLTWNDRRCAMVGAIPADVLMHERPQGRGYVRLRETGKGPWPLIDPTGRPAELNAHEFHYSSLIDLDEGIEYAYEVLRGVGVDGRHDGVVYKNVLANYCHLRHVGGNDWATRFVSYVRGKRRAAPRALRPAVANQRQAGRTAIATVI